MTTRNRQAPPSSLTPIFGKLVKELKKLQSPNAWYKTIDWSKYLSAPLAEAIKETRYRNQRLLLTIHSSLVAQELHHLKPTLLQALSSDFPDHVIRDIRHTLKQ